MRISETNEPKYETNFSYISILRLREPPDTDTINLTFKQVEYERLRDCENFYYLSGVGKAIYYQNDVFDFGILLLSRTYADATLSDIIQRIQMTNEFVIVDINIFSDQPRDYVIKNLPEYNISEYKLHLLRMMVMIWKIRDKISRIRQFFFTNANKKFSNPAVQDMNDKIIRSLEYQLSTLQDKLNELSEDIEIANMNFRYKAIIANTEDRRPIPEPPGGETKKIQDVNVSKLGRFSLERLTGIVPFNKNYK